jgi:hypothetical protein
MPAPVAPIPVIPDVSDPSAASASQFFEDIRDVAWAVEAVEGLRARGIINGKSGAVFAPNDTITREEFTKILIGAFDLADANASSGFSDADENGWYYQYISSAFAKGIIKGRADGSFGVGSPITRQDIAVAIFRTLSFVDGVSEQYGQNEPFTDNANIDEYAVEAVYRLRNMGVINGMENNSFMPQNNSTRAEASVMIYRVLQLAK